MRKDDFLEIHGRDAWFRMVRPRIAPDSPFPYPERKETYAAEIVDAEIRGILFFLGFESSQESEARGLHLSAVGLLRAAELWDSTSKPEPWQNETWEQVLKMFYSEKYILWMLQRSIKTYGERKPLNKRRRKKKEFKPSA